MYIPPDPEADPSDKEAATAAELLQQTIMQTANIRKTTGDVLVFCSGEREIRDGDLSSGAFAVGRAEGVLDLEDFRREHPQRLAGKIRRQMGYLEISREVVEAFREAQALELEAPRPLEVG